MVPKYINILGGGCGLNFLQIYVYNQPHLVAGKDGYDALLNYALEEHRLSRKSTDGTMPLLGKGYKVVGEGTMTDLGSIYLMRGNEEDGKLPPDLDHLVSLSNHVPSITFHVILNYSLITINH